MPDISMCFGDGCPEREDCVRYMAVPKFVQSYGEFYKIRRKEGCEFFVPFVRSDQMKRESLPDSVVGHLPPFDRVDTR